MKYTWFFILALIAVSGFIAWFGDLLGRKMGKKRLSIFGMRPRHTAIFMTTITGMIISAIAIGTLLLVNSEFKKVLTHGEIILSQNKKLTKLNSSLEKKTNTLTNTIKKLSADITDKQVLLDSARNETIKALDERNKAAASVKRLEFEIERRRQELIRIKKSNNLANLEIASKTKQLSAIQIKLNSIHKELYSAQEKVVVANQKLKKQQTDLQKLEVMLKTQQDKLLQLGKENIAIERQAWELRTVELIMKQGDEILRKTVSSNKSQLGSKQLIIDVLNTASDICKDLGAKVGDNGRTIQLMYRSPQYGILIGEENELIDEAAKALSNNPEGDTLVQILCARNTLKGEQAQVELKLYYNKRVYSKDQMIASTILDGTQSEGRILLSVIDFLQNKLSIAAVEAGIVPASNSVRKSEADNSTSRVDELMKLVDSIKAANSKVKVEVYSADNIYAAGPLNLENMSFKVVPIDSSGN